MPILSRRSLLALPLVAALPSRADETSVPNPPVFDKIFPNPTGANGYEEIVRAGEIVKASEARHMNTRYVPLADKRKHLADCRDALALFRRGLAKPIQMASLDYGEPAGWEAGASLRAIARLLTVELYVACADSANGVAPRIARDALTLTYAMRGDSVISLLIAIALEAIVLSRIVTYRDSLSVADCRRVIRLMEETLAQPTNAPQAIEAERQSLLRLIQGWRDTPETLAVSVEATFAIDTANESPITDAQLQKEQQAAHLADTLRADAALRSRVINELPDTGYGAITYELYSAGALLAGENGAPDRRERITFPWTKPP